MPSALRAKYKDSVRDELQQEFEIKQCDAGARDRKSRGEHGRRRSHWRRPAAGGRVGTQLALITGQQPSIRAARKSISNFKLREGAKIGCMVTLRGERMYEFMDRLFNVAMPRIRDFRGVSAKAFDNFGNYTLGIRDQTIFPEVDQDKVDRPRGMNITFVVKNSETADSSRALLRKLGMPFAN